MEIKAIFLDIDGTLINSNRVIDKQTKDALIAFQKQGGTVILSSARPYVGVLQYGKVLQLDRYGGYYSSFNGGQIVKADTLESYYSTRFTMDETKEVFQKLKQIETKMQQEALLPYNDIHAFSLDTAKDIYHVIDDNQFNIMTYQDDTLIMMKLEIYSQLEAFVNHMKTLVNEDFISAIHNDPVKFLISGKPTFMKQYFKEIYDLLGNKYEVVTSTPFFIEITPKGINKGNALDDVLQLLHVSHEESMAFGDSMNDIPMIQRAGIGVAMGNASNQVKEAADYVTKSNDESGIAHFINRYLLSNKR